MINSMGSMVIFLLLMAVVWVWGLVILTAWRHRRLASRGPDCNPGRDWLVQATLKTSGFLYLAILTALVVNV